jgi:chemotaxis signal transduction protein
VEESPLQFAQPPAEFLPGKYLTFRIGRNEFAMEATRVRGMLPGHEVIAPENLEVAPAAAREMKYRPAGKDDDDDWIAGKTIFQGEAIPVVDLRAKLRLRRGIPGRNPCVVVVEVAVPDTHRIGFLVDGVADIINARARDFAQGKLRIGRPRQVLDVSILFDATRKLQLLPTG